MICNGLSPPPVPDLKCRIVPGPSDVTRSRQRLRLRSRIADSDQTMKVKVSPTVADEDAAASVGGLAAAPRNPNSEAKLEYGDNNSVGDRSSLSVQLEHHGDTGSVGGRSGFSRAPTEGSRCRAVRGAGAVCR